MTVLRIGHAFFAILDPASKGQKRKQQANGLLR
jgi:hypothetical protein